MIDLSIEYAHTYTDRAFSEETAASVVLLAERLRGAPDSRQLLVLVDDYSPDPPDTFDYAGFLARLGHHGAAPDLLVKESALLGANRMVLAELGDTRLGRQLRRYVEMHERHPCSLFVASWYLARLGHLHHPALPIVPAHRLLNILPERFREFEDRALDIIVAVAGLATAARVETLYFPSPLADESGPLWDRFDPEAYIFNNYLTLLPADLYTLAATYRRYRARAPLPRALDLGTGPGLLPVLAMLPSVECVDLYEPGQRNADYLERQRHQLDPAWDAPIAALRLLDPALAGFDFQRELRARAVVHRGDHRDLPAGLYDAVSMHYVAESATRDRTEFRRIARRAAVAAKPGALVSMAFMERSDGYTVDGVPFPAVPVAEPDIRDLLGPLVRDQVVERLDRSSGPARHGYTGHLLLSATRTA